MASLSLACLLKQKYGGDDPRAGAVTGQNKRAVNRAVLYIHLFFYTYTFAYAKRYHHHDDDHHSVLTISVAYYIATIIIVIIVDITPDITFWNNFMFSMI